MGHVDPGQRAERVDVGGVRVHEAAKVLAHDLRAEKAARRMVALHLHALEHDVGDHDPRVAHDAGHFAHLVGRQDDIPVIVVHGPNDLLFFLGDLELFLVQQVEALLVGQFNGNGFHPISPLLV